MGRTHTDSNYERLLDEVRQSLLLMAGRVEEMTTRAMEALTQRDVTLAEATILLDRKVNRAERETDELCLRILATRQPMASDLRFLTLALKMVTDLERVGDLAVNICERVNDLAAVPTFEIHPQIPPMAAIAQSMVSEAIDAFVNADASRAAEVISRDKQVDELYEQVFGELVTTMIASPNLLHEAIHVLSVAKWLERMGDHGTNLAEQVIFLVRGRDVRHAGKLPGEGEDT